MNSPDVPTIGFIGRRDYSAMLSHVHIGGVYLDIAGLGSVNSAMKK